MVKIVIVLIYLVCCQKLFILNYCLNTWFGENKIYPPDILQSMNFYSFCRETCTFYPHYCCQPAWPLSHPRSWLPVKTCCAVYRQLSFNIIALFLACSYLVYFVHKFQPLLDHNWTWSVRFSHWLFSYF